MTRRPAPDAPTLLLLAALALAPGCGVEGPTTSKEIAPRRPSDAGAAPSPLADPNAATKAPRAIATH